ncbi:MAG: thiamine-phosphate pyrophosphorylase [Deltaproteobacteria bacterium]
MPRDTGIKGVYRIIDANINRAKEGLRVCEEVLRFIVCDRALVAGFKECRHRLEKLSASYRADPRLLRERESMGDVGRTIKSGSESRRGGWRDIFAANLQRVKESVRVLEEFSKLHDRAAAAGFKALRYRIYELEKKALQKRDLR